MFHGSRRTRQEAVKLHQELEVDIVALGGSAVSALDVVAVEIDTCRVKSRRQPFASGMLKLGMLSIFSLYLLPASFESKNEGKKKRAAPQPQEIKRDSN